jgi:uncharacterized protein YbaP (TraB family)
MKTVAATEAFCYSEAMASGASKRALSCAVALAFLIAVPLTNAASCVWKVTAPDGGTLYLGGSIHMLRSIDYPLPGAYNRAFEASSRLAFEVDRKALLGSGDAMVKSGQYLKGDSLKNHVDPRTYAYLQKLFGLMHVPEATYGKLRPWLIVAILQNQGSDARDDLGVEAFLMKRAQANSKPIMGLESLEEHVRVFSGLSDRQSEALLLLTFIPQSEKSSQNSMTDAWRRGDADYLARLMANAYGDFPFFGRRLLEERNRNWMPKIERELHSGKTCFVVVGAAHLGGSAGLVNLLRERGYKLEQL